MFIKCHGCGIEKDMHVLETFPYEESTVTTEIPIEPLFVLECQPNGPGFGIGEWRVAIVCHECFYKISPDMWISQRCWESINPKIPFLNLPLNNLPMNTAEEIAAKWNPESYVNKSI